VAKVVIFQTIKFSLHECCAKSILFAQMLKKVFFLTVIISALAAHAVAQILPTFGDSRTGTTGMQFLKISPDARAMSLGNTGVALANDASAMYWNPAAIAEIDTGRLHTQFSNTRYFGDITSNFAGAVLKAGKLSYVGIHVFSMNYGTMNETTEFEPLGTGRTFTITNYTVGVTYAKVLTNNFIFGLNGKFANEGAAGVNVNNVMFDLGLKYNVGVKGARFGINFANFGMNVKPNGEVQVLKFDGVQTITDFSTVTVPAIFRIGAAFDPIDKGEHKLTLATQLNHPTDNNETYGLGAEYSYLGLGYLRAGYEFASDDRFRMPSFGMGIKLRKRFGNIGFDYGIIARNNLGNIHRITLSIGLR
jgi:hypothetical protein